VTSQHSEKKTEADAETEPETDGTTKYNPRAPAVGIITCCAIWCLNTENHEINAKPFLAPMANRTRSNGQQDHQVRRAVALGAGPSLAFVRW
jgi:hypothetical protein